MAGAVKKIENEVKGVFKVPTYIGANKGTVGLIALSILSGVLGGFLLNRFDNVLTRNLNSIKAGQTPIGI